jgi:predicted nucleic acid-binding protein
MSTPLLYLDTSVIGGYFDSEFMADTRTLWRLMEAGVFRFGTSRVVLNELGAAPLCVRELAASTFPGGSNLLEVSPEAFALAQAYLAAGVVPLRYSDDALHVAVATCEGFDFVVSWNFKHLAKPSRNERFNGVNELHDRPQVRIVSPTQLSASHENQKT